MSILDRGLSSWHSGITVDLRELEAKQQELQARNIPFALFSPDDPRVIEETQRGYGVMWVVESDLPPGFRDKLEQTARGIYDDNSPSSLDISQLSNIYAQDTDLTTQSAYLRELATIAPLDEGKLGDHLQAVQTAFESATAKEENPIRGLPTLLSWEDYEWEVTPGNYQEASTWRLSIDSSKLQGLTQYLERQKIPYEVASNPKDLEAESRLGYQLIRIKESDLSQKIKGGLLKKSGHLLDANLGENYWERLNELAQGIATSESPESTPNQSTLSVPIVSNPTIEKIEKPLEEDQVSEAIATQFVNKQVQINQQVQTSISEPVTATNLQSTLSNSPAITQKNSLETLFDSLPLSNNLMTSIQAERTKIIAPILADFLKARKIAKPEDIHYNQSSNIMSFKGKEYSLEWNGQNLSLISNKTGLPKMIAEYQPDRSWKSVNLPSGVEGLTAQDLQTFNRPELIENTRKVIIRHEQTKHLANQTLMGKLVEKPLKI